MKTAAVILLVVFAYVSIAGYAGHKIAHDVNIWFNEVLQK